jgi:hypothetical protein
MWPLWKIFTDNWDIILMYPVLFAAAVFIGWLSGWAVVRIVYNQRLAHQADMIANLRAVLEEKLPASFLPPIKRNRGVSFPLILVGLGLAFVGIAIATGGAVWQMWRVPFAAEAAPTVPIRPAILPGPGSPLAREVEAFLAKRGKAPKWNTDANGPATVGLASLGPSDTEFISRWDASLGSWPTENDGFTRAQVYLFPKRKPDFRLQFDKEKFRGEVDELQTTFIQKMGGMLKMSEELFASPGTQGNKEKILKIDALYQELDSLLFVRNGQSDGTLFDKSNYKELLMGALLDDWQTNWVNYRVAFADLKRAIALLEQTRRYPDNTELISLASNIGPQNELFRDRMSALRGWLIRENQCIEMLISVI